MPRHVLLACNMAYPKKKVYGHPHVTHPHAHTHTHTLRALFYTTVASAEVDAHFAKLAGPRVQFCVSAVYCIGATP